MKQIRLMGSQELDRMRAAGQAAAELLDLLSEYVAPGISTDNLNSIAERWAAERGIRHAPLGYLAGGEVPFPKSICTSVNEVVCHGIPSVSQILREGDILNIDVTPIVEGYHGDTSRMFAVGTPSDVAARLIQTTQECLELGITAVKPGGHVGDIGAAIQKHAEKAGFGLVREYTGHGVGRIFHTEPIIPHYGSLFTGVRFEPGMVFTIEPMLNVGTWKTTLDSNDHWTVRTADGALSAQAEHTVAVTQDGVEVLTKRRKNGNH